MKVQSPYQRIYCVQLVPQRKQCYRENSGPLMWLTRFQCFIGGWQDGISMFSFSSALLFFQHILHCIESVCVHLNPLMVLTTFSFFFLSKLRLWQQAIGILYCLSSHGLKIATQDADDTGAATSSLSSKDAVSAGKYLNLTCLFCGDSYACVCFELSISVCLTNLWDLNL